MRIAMNTANINLPMPIQVDLHKSSPLQVMHSLMMAKAPVIFISMDYIQVLATFELREISDPYR